MACDSTICARMAKSSAFWTFGRLQLVVAPPAEDHRHDALSSRSFGDEADENPVITGFDGVFQRADGVSRGVVIEDRAADRAFGTAPFDRIELAGHLGRHLASESLAAGGEDVGRETACVLDRGQRVGCLIDAGQSEGWLERDGTESAHGQTARQAIVAECGEDHNAARKTGHDFAKPLRLDHRTDHTQRGVNEHLFVKP